MRFRQLTKALCWIVAILGCLTLYQMKYPGIIPKSSLFFAPSIDIDYLAYQEFYLFMKRMQDRPYEPAPREYKTTPYFHPPLTSAINETIAKGFFNIDLIKYPSRAGGLSSLLLSSQDVISEAQRIHYKVLGELIGHYKYAMLFDMAAFENKGDPAITVGEMYLLRRLGIELVYYCNYYACQDQKNLDFARSLASYFSNSSLVLLLHGGGNLVGYHENDKLRFRLLEMFPDYQFVMFPQSIWLRTAEKAEEHLQFCERNYSHRANLVLILRDRQSLSLARKHFNGTRKLMVPDMAFQIGPVTRFMAPIYDILWLRREDDETPNYTVPAPPSGVSLHVADWWKWLTPKGSTTMEDALLMATNGFLFLQRGRVVVTDRLHGHILSTLLGIPHVLIDNPAHKLSSYHYTWTISLRNVILVDNPDSALSAALTLLNMTQLPTVLPFMETPETVKKQLEKVANLSKDMLPTSLRSPMKTL